MYKTIFSNEDIKVVITGRDYDCIAYVENLTEDKDVIIIFKDDEIESITLSNMNMDENDYYQMLANDLGYAQLEALRKGEYSLKVGNNLYDNREVIQ